MREYNSPPGGDPSQTAERGWPGVGFPMAVTAFSCPLPLWACGAALRLAGAPGPVLPMSATLRDNLRPGRLHLGLSLKILHLIASIRR